MSHARLVASGARDRKEPYIMLFKMIRHSPPPVPEKSGSIAKEGEEMVSWGFRQCPAEWWHPFDIEETFPRDTILKCTSSFGDRTVFLFGPGPAQLVLAKRIPESLTRNP